ncbi:MAG: aminoacyl-tRNA hydrolase [Candidatus Peribacter sp.]|jgi:peptidyl-tRNA hydrolase, PTH1 family|nr:aminoacyl-tRNA hydrolase [Candidatus Peribacter sp.]MBT4392805.1 aminoacyl-tRNA hydrolase [Candidatus Peribacter sp.]MBT4600578.1 aminoacyl-tRNA hydrolase [Candidatus Peribacter sp.]MBT5148753.1 aminoacyl-tRNA hydrolase [Candidatus Peribacter sp.]MBT5637652.1 aminoacyl-tRNA hydrolase [Candidatus Peribacter sp.]
MKPSLVIFGLGNPGAQYERTRHNAGYLALDVLSKEFGQDEWQDKQKFDSFIQEARVGVAPVLLVKPKTFMNLSGDSVRKVVDFYKLDAATQILVLSDDIDIAPGELRLRMKGGPGTHNGLKSIVDGFGEDFPRIRIGLGGAPAGQDLSNWVLSTFMKEEIDTLSESFKELPKMIEEFVLGESS